MMSLPPAAAVALMIALAMAMRLSAAAPIGLPGCDTNCGNVSVPYPFGMSPECSWQGLHLTCDRSHAPPRLLLGDGTLRVTEIDIERSKVCVVRTAGSIINTTTGDLFNSSQGSWNVPFGRGFTEYGYLLSEDNELVVMGCNVFATLLANGTGEEGNPTGRIAGCASLCTKAYPGGIATGGDQQCSGTSGCCKSPITMPSPPIEVEARQLYSRSDTLEEKQMPVNVFVAKKGWIDDNLNLNLVRADDYIKEAPFVLDWSVTWGLPQVPHPHVTSQPGAQDQACRMLCKSQHYCWTDGYSGAGRRCGCYDGYQGNPYFPGGCEDIDECKLPREESGCFGECTNKIGSMECRCLHGTFGNPGARDGCVKIKSRDEDALLPPTVAPAPFVLHPNCDTTCGDVRIPYPFGIGPAAAGCSLPGFNLTCDTSYHPPRLFLDSNGTLEVVNISVADSTVHVIHHGSITSNPYFLHNSKSYIDTYTTVYYDIPHIGEPYTLSTSHEFIFSGCHVQATLYGDGNRIISSCNSICSSTRNYIMNKDGLAPLVRKHTDGRYCSGRDDGCCHAPIAAGSSTPKRMEFKGLKNHHNSSMQSFEAVAFITEGGLTNQWGMILNRTDLSTSNMLSSPLVLRWAIKQGVTALPGNSSGQFCRQEDGGGFTCHCNKGYQGNPYIAGGCKDINECAINMTLSGKVCYGECINLPGRFKCRCPRGSSGNPLKPGGCSYTGLIIGAAIGPTLLLLVPGIILLLRWMKQHKAKVLKQKYFKQNRGHLLQQLVSQEVDIAERMIIPVDELAKATNNFDKARELGGGGHGTVYKGILSNLRVVAIKKPNSMVQKEIDEFINEVAILSQINHRNVVKLFGCCLETEVPLLVYEFISNGTLHEHLHDKGPRSLSWDNRLRIATEVATSLAYLHSAVSIPIIHRDIKSANILLDDTLTSKVADFGASRYIPIEKTGLTTRVQGTRGYMDPMYFYTGRLTEKSDVYSFGVVLVELLTRKKPVSYLSTDGDGLVVHFIDLIAAGKLSQILDPQVIEEGGDEVQEVAALAASCINLLRGEERPTMRQVEHTLEGLWGSKRYKRDDAVAPEFEDDSIVTDYSL